MKPDLSDVAATVLRREDDMGEVSANAALCSNAGCFDEAAFVVIPTGRWSKLKPRNACKCCAKSMAAAFESKSGEPGGAVIQKIPREPRKPKVTKPPAKPARSKKDLKRVDAQKDVGDAYYDCHVASCGYMGAKPCPAHVATGGAT